MKTYFDLTEKEIADRVKLTPAERFAIDTFISAAKALPKTLHISIDDFNHELSVSKRITRGSSQFVFTLKKKSLFL